MARTGTALGLRIERPWREHGALYRDLFADPAVAARLWPGPLGGARTGEQAEAILSSDILHWQRRSFGPWVCFELASGAFVGRGGLTAGTVAEQQCIELVCALRADAWGLGYATEITTRALSEARRLGLTEVVACVPVDDTASRRVLAKTGVRVERRVEIRGSPHWLGRCRLIV